MFNKEAELVNKEFIAQDNNYNICIGGGIFLTTDCVSVKDKNNNYSMVHLTDPRYLSDEFISHNIGQVTVRDINGKITNVYKTDPRYLNGELLHANTKNINVIDENNNIIKISINDSRYLTGKLKYVKITKNNNNIQ